MKQINDETPKRNIILKEIFSEFISLDNSRSNFKKAFSSDQRAEVLIELLEVNDCGSIGGFDWCTLKKFGIYSNNDHNIVNIFDRYLIVLYKYHSLHDVCLKKSLPIMTRIANLYESKLYKKVFVNRTMLEIPLRGK